MKRLILAAALVALALPAAAQQKVRIGTEGAYAPWNATDSSGKLVGFEIELGMEICKRQNLDCTFTAQAFDGIIPALNQSRFDAIMAGMSVTARRLEVIDFSSPYAGTPSVFAVSKTGRLAAITTAVERITMAELSAEETAAIEKLKADLKGRTIGVQRATIQERFLEEYMKGVVTVRLYDTNDNLLLDLNAGRVDAGFASYSYWFPAQQKDAGKNLALVGPGFSGGVFGSGVGIGVRKGDAALLASLNEGIAKLKADGTIKRLSMEWFKFDATVD